MRGKAWAGTSLRAARRAAIRSASGGSIPGGKSATSSATAAKDISLQACTRPDRRRRIETAGGQRSRRHLAHRSELRAVPRAAEHERDRPRMGDQLPAQVDGERLDPLPPVAAAPAPGLAPATSARTRSTRARSTAALSGK